MSPRARATAKHGFPVQRLRRTFRRSCQDFSTPYGDQSALPAPNDEVAERCYVDLRRPHVTLFPGFSIGRVEVHEFKLR